MLATRGIKCAHCKGRHDAVADVLECAVTHGAYDDGRYGDAEAERATEERYERWLEDGGAHANVIAWEHEQDRQRGWADPAFLRDWIPELAANDDDDDDDDTARGL